jgi:hypothetical protein
MLVDARSAAQVPGRGAKALAGGNARCASQVTNRCFQAVSRGAATLPPQEKSNSAEVPQNGLNIAGFICTATW